MGGEAAVAYLWARTVTCKNCRATIPLLKTLWLCRKPNKRIRLVMEPNADGTGVVFSIEHNVPERGGNAAQKREHDKKLGMGHDVSGGCAMPLLPGYHGDGEFATRDGMEVGPDYDRGCCRRANGKEYRLPTEHERRVAEVKEDAVREAFKMSVWVS